MSYIFGKLWHSAIIWPIRKSFQCILQGIRFLLANQTRLSGTSDNESYTGIYALWIIRKPIKQTPWPYCIGLPWRTHRPLQTSWGPLSTPKHAPWPHWIFRITEQLKSRNVAWGIADFCTIYPGSCYHLLSVWYFKSTLGETGPSSPILGSLSLFLSLWQ